MKMSKHPKMDFDIFLPQHIHHKMLAYAQACDGEISGWGKTQVVKKKNSNEYLVTVTDIRIFDQVVTPVHTTLSTDSLTPFFLQLIKDGELLQHWNFWWHSHFKMSPFFSHEDEMTIKKMAKGRLYSICINQAGELVARVDEKGKNLVENLSVRIENPISPALFSSCKAEIRKKVKYETIVPAVPFVPVMEPFVNFPAARINPYADDRDPTSPEIQWYERDKIRSDETERFDIGKTL